MGVLAVVAVIGFAAFQLMPKTPVVEALVPVPVRSAAPAVAPPEASGAVVAPPVAPSVSAVVPPPGPVGTTEVDAGVSVAPSLPLIPAKPKGNGGRIEDPYDAAAPGPAKTVAPVVPPPLAPTVAPSVPPPPPLPSTKPSASPTGPIGGPPQY